MRVSNAKLNTINHNLMYPCSTIALLRRNKYQRKPFTLIWRLYNTSPRLALIKIPSKFSTVPPELNPPLLNLSYTEPTRFKHYYLKWILHHINRYLGMPHSIRNCVQVIGLCRCSPNQSNKHKLHNNLATSLMEHRNNPCERIQSSNKCSSNLLSLS